MHFSKIGDVNECLIELMLDNYGDNLRARLFGGIETEILVQFFIRENKTL